MTRREAPTKTEKQLRDILRSAPDMEAIADWMDTLDKLGARYIEAAARTSPGHAEQARAAINTLNGSEVQDDLRRFGALIADALLTPEAAS